MSKPARYVFLDFDGVTHRYFPVEGETDERNAHFAFVPYILAAIKAQPHEVKVVISSSWRESFSLDKMCEHLGELAPWVIGSTPVRGRSCEWGDRLAEVRAWIEENDPGAAWVALDDCPELYARDEEDMEDIAVVACPDCFGQEQGQMLIEAIANPGGWSSKHPVPVKFNPGN